MKSIKNKRIIKYKINTLRKIKMKHNIPQDLTDEINTYLEENSFFQAKEIKDKLNNIYSPLRSICVVDNIAAHVDYMMGR